MRLTFKGQASEAGYQKTSQLTRPMYSSAAGAAAPAAEPMRGSVARHLANRTEMRFSGSDSYALLFLFC